MDKVINAVQKVEHGLEYCAQTFGLRNIFTM